jgi:hypothetical protein
MSTYRRNSGGGYRSTCAWTVRRTVHILFPLFLIPSHALVRDIYSFPRVCRVAIEYITKYDNPSPPDLKDKRKVFVGGGSLGGWTSLEYGLNPTENTAGIISWVFFP